MTRRTFLLAAVLAAAGRPAGAQAPQRIVSLVPSVTEMIFAIGDGRRVVGVSNYDTFPPEVTAIQHVGGLFDPDIERIFGLRADLVIVYNTQTDLKRRLDHAAIPYYSYEHRTLGDITATLRSVGARIGSRSRAEAVASQMDQSIAAIRSSVARMPRPRTLLVFGREPGTLRNIDASGGYGFLHDMLDAAGGTDVFADIKQQLVQASTEMILARRPDVIVELRYGDSLKNRKTSQDLDAWNALGSVPAVRNHRIYVLTGDQFVVPGPRVVDATRILARTLHPEATK